MIALLQVQRLEIFGEDHDGIPNEEMGKVCGEEIVHSAIHESLLDILIHHEIGIEIFLSQTGVLGRDVGGVGGIS